MLAPIYLTIVIMLRHSLCAHESIKEKAAVEHLLDELKWF